MDTETPKRTAKKPGRKPKNDTARFIICCRLNEEENNLLEGLIFKSGVESRTKFFKHALFNKEIKVVTIDKNTKDYFMRLTNIYTQFRSISNNYNQTVRAVKANFGDKRAAALLYKLEKETMKLAYLSTEILSLTEEYERKYLRK